MNVRKLAAAVAATAITSGVGMAIAPSASATDNIKVFGEQERLIGPNGFPYIGYVVKDLAPSNAPVPHNGKLFSAKLWVDGFGGNYNPMIDRFGARAQNGTFYPAIPGASNTSVLYFDVVGVEPNSVVWNDGVRDILAWIPGEIPLEGFWEAPPAPEPAPMPEDSMVIPETGSEGGSAMPAESDAELKATPNYIPSPEQPLTEGIVSMPGFHG